MFEILSTTSHGNAVKLFNLPNDYCIRKVGTSERSKFYIANEIQGLKWYTAQLDGDPFEQKVSYNFGESLTVLDIPILEKYIQVSHLASLNVTFKYLLIVINHYETNWPDTLVTNAHGDLTLANVLLWNERAFIIDWEHFVEGQLPKGYDLFYLILSALILPNYSRFKK